MTQVKLATGRVQCSRRGTLRRVGQLFLPYRWSLVAVTAIIVASSLAAMVSPFLLRDIIDTALPTRNVRLLAWLVGGMVAVVVVISVLGVMQTWIATKVGQLVLHRLRTQLFSHLQRQSLAFFTQTRGGEIQSRITNDIGGMEAAVTYTATTIASNLTTAVATMVAMVALSWQLSLISLAVLPPAIYLTRRVARLRRASTAMQQRELANLNVAIDEGLSVDGARLSKVTGAGAALAERFTASSERLTELELRSQLAGRWQIASTSVVFSALPPLIYLAAGLPVTGASLTAGTVIAFTALQNMLFRPITGLLSVGVSLTSSLALFDRVFEYLDLPVGIDDPAEPAGIDCARMPGHVRVQNVSFTYPAGHVPALVDVDLDVPAGSSVAVVGETGSGKTTLAALLCHLYEPSAGSISIDGVDLRDMRLADTANLVGIVSQDTYLLHATVAENLRWGKPDATDEEIRAAARAAQIHEVITALPDGYDTVVGARGHRFSGGEKQRLSIARTLLRDPRVLILDEATSALDNDTERAVQQALDTVTRGRTTITIAHRLSTVRNAGQIVVLADGRIVESGTHRGLLGLSGRYAQLAAA